ncbi:hypothetical protein FSHL1_006415 [Fusarium sambucinum]
MGDQNQSETGIWGFTIYRTYYGVGSDRQWENLIATARRGVLAKLIEVVGEQNRDETEEVASWFYLDARSDIDLLDGVDFQTTRKLYNNQTGTHLPVDGVHVFLIADEEALGSADKGRYFLKAVDADASGLETENDDGTEEPKYWGWMRIGSDQLQELWGINPRYNMLWAVNEAELHELVWEGNSGR